MTVTVERNKKQEQAWVEAQFPDLFNRPKGNFMPDDMKPGESVRTPCFICGADPVRNFIKVQVRIGDRFKYGISPMCDKHAREFMTPFQELDSMIDWKVRVEEVV